MKQNTVYRSKNLSLKNLLIIVIASVLVLSTYTFVITPFLNMGPEHSNDVTVPASKVLYYENNMPNTNTRTGSYEVVDDYDDESMIASKSNFNITGSQAYLTCTGTGPHSVTWQQSPDQVKDAHLDWHGTIYTMSDIRMFMTRKRVRHREQNVSLACQRGCWKRAASHFLPPD